MKLIKNKWFPEEPELIDLERFNILINNVADFEGTYMDLCYEHLLIARCLFILALELEDEME